MTTTDLYPPLETPTETAHSPPKAKSVVRRLPPDQRERPVRRMQLNGTQAIALTLAVFLGLAGIYLIATSYSGGLGATGSNNYLRIFQSSTATDPADDSKRSFSPTNTTSAPGISPQEMQMHHAATLLDVASRFTDKTQRNELFSALERRLQDD